ncbi:precorrin-6A synthase (deacetylating) [Roseobacter weihaiensis]|uniref:precorrin-6A synthase (deacetylating) n=1 Tax=Roseobacter weihaiensis TaxID=2763262 RepID=UPI001D0B0862|nr:precorrin-6A synthase (deacetylating) [Roseobacter sp. H9]
MIEQLWLIGIGTGSPEHITREGAKALREAAAVLLPRKGPGKDDLATLRLNILQDVGSPAQVLDFDMPVRDETLPYQARVAKWHDEIAQIWESTLAAAEVEGPVALLVWGDPGLYDSTLRIAGRLSPKPALRVVPGITALQALTAAHAVPFNTIDGSVCVTTGQQLRENGMPAGVETVLVMLDGQCSFQSLEERPLYIWWGAFLGMEEQLLRAGPLHEVGSGIVKLRAEARATHGWIMDTYMLRRTPD